MRHLTFYIDRTLRGSAPKNYSTRLPSHIVCVIECVNVSPISLSLPHHRCQYQQPQQPTEKKTIVLSQSVSINSHFSPVTLLLPVVIDCFPNHLLPFPIYLSFWLGSFVLSLACFLVADTQSILSCLLLSVCLYLRIELRI